MAISHNGQNEITHAFDAKVYDSCLVHKTAAYRLEITAQEEGQLLQVKSYTPDINEGFCKAGSFIQHLDPYFLESLPYSRSPEPVISCIILLTFNCHYVQNFLIPSIIAYTTIPYEIIVVYNGIATDLTPFKNFNLIHSETGCVSKAYNKGVAAANGRYISIFHDDCLVTSSGWHEPMIEAIDNGAFATSTEMVYHPHFSLEYLKGTPLLMTKANYEFIGGHDEFYFAGIEDLDFSYRIQLRGKFLKKVSTPYRHFRGMSTVILLSDEPAEMRALFGYCLVPENAIEKWKTRCMGSCLTQEMMQAVNCENLHYFKVKRSMSAHSDKLTNVRSVSIEQYPALSNIRDTYKEWLSKKFSACEIL